MLITQKIGHISTTHYGSKAIDTFPLEWHETGKRIMHKRTSFGRELQLRFLNENQTLCQGDILFEDAATLIMVEILPCDTIILVPESMHEMALICYEIGNKHLPLFYEDGKLLIPYEAPIYNMLKASGFNPQRETRQLLNRLRTSVASHNHNGSQGESLFSKILKLTTTND